MRLKLFKAPTLDQAKRAVTQEMGNDAIILTINETIEGVEIRAAIDRAPIRKMAMPTSLAARKRVKAAPSENMRDQIHQTLMQAGSSPAFANIIASASAKLAANAVDLRATLANILEHTIGFSPLPFDHSAPIHLVGLPGTGRSTIAKRLKTRAKQEGLMAEVIGHNDIDPPRLSAGLTIFDGPADHPFAATSPKPKTGNYGEQILVMGADGHYEDLEEIARYYAENGVQRAIITRLDLTRKRGAVLSALAAARLKVAHLHNPNQYNESLAPASPGFVADLLVSSQQNELKFKGVA